MSNAQWKMSNGKWVNRFNPLTLSICPLPFYILRPLLDRLRLRHRHRARAADVRAVAAAVALAGDRVIPAGLAGAAVLGRLGADLNVPAEDGALIDDELG